MNGDIKSITPYQREVKLICHELERYSHASVVEALVGALAMPKTEGQEALMRMPWTQYLLLKFSLIGVDGSEKISKERFSDLVNRLYDLQHLAVDFGVGSLEIAIRPMLLQQTWYQRAEVKLLRQIFRQSALFLSGGSGWYAKEFYRISGVSLKNFFIITFAIHFQLKVHGVTAMHVNLVSLLCYLCPGMAVQEIINYFKLIGVRLEDLPDYFKSHVLADVPASEYFQDTPLREKPVLIEGGRLLVVDDTLFLTGISELVPVLLKKKLGTLYKDKFGGDFQSYVGRLLAGLPGELFNDEAVMSLYRENRWEGMSADFILVGEREILVFECKGLEPGPIVRSTANSGVLKSHLQQDLRKGVFQVARTANLLATLPQYASYKFYGAVVTHFGFGMFDAGWVAENVDPGMFADLHSNYPDSVIGLDEILILTVDDVEEVCRGAYFNKFNIFEVFEQAVAGQLDPKSRRFFFEQVLMGRLNGVEYPPSEVLDEVNSLYGQLLEIFNRNTEFWKGDVQGLFREYEVVMRMLSASG
ncbi:hypothetical protein ACT048_20630 [Ectopseudomonas khazarica]|uniref:hypothetical protein n=1 Tax=Ectopseudomonas khazarica TaxID=2502979 RepID=UPI0040344583